MLLHSSQAPGFPHLRKAFLELWYIKGLNETQKKADIAGTHSHWSLTQLDIVWKTMDIAEHSKECTRAYGHILSTLAKLSAAWLPSNLKYANCPTLWLQAWLAERPQRLGELQGFLMSSELAFWLWQGLASVVSCIPDPAAAATAVAAAVAEATTAARGAEVFLKLHVGGITTHARAASPAAPASDGSDAAAEEEGAAAAAGTGDASRQMGACKGCGWSPTGDFNPAWEQAWEELMKEIQFLLVLNGNAETYLTHLDLLQHCLLCSLQLRYWQQHTGGGMEGKVLGSKACGRSSTCLDSECSSISSNSTNGSGSNGGSFKSNGECSSSSSSNGGGSNGGSSTGNGSSTDRGSSGGQGSGGGSSSGGGVGSRGGNAVGTSSSGSGDQIRMGRHRSSSSSSSSCGLGSLEHETTTLSNGDNSGNSSSSCASGGRTDLKACKRGSGSGSGSLSVSLLLPPYQMLKCQAWSWDRALVAGESARQQLRAVGAALASELRTSLSTRDLAIQAFSVESMRAAAGHAKCMWAAAAGTAAATSTAAGAGAPQFSTPAAAPSTVAAERAAGAAAASKVTAAAETAAAAASSSAVAGGAALQPAASATATSLSAAAAAAASAGGGGGEGGHGFSAEGPAGAGAASTAGGAGVSSGHETPADISAEGAFSVGPMQISLIVKVLERLHQCRALEPQGGVAAGLCDWLMLLCMVLRCCSLADRVDYMQAEGGQLLALLMRWMMDEQQLQNSMAAPAAAAAAAAGPGGQKSVGNSSSNRGDGSSSSNNRGAGSSSNRGGGSSSSNNRGNGSSSSNRDNGYNSSSSSRGNHNRGIGSSGKRKRNGRVGSSSSSRVGDAGVGDNSSSSSSSSSSGPRAMEEGSGGSNSNSRSYAQISEQFQWRVLGGTLAPGVCWGCPLTFSSSNYSSRRGMVSTGGLYGMLITVLVHLLLEPQVAEGIEVAGQDVDGSHAILGGVVGEELCWGC